MFRNRVTIERYSFTQSNTGGLTKVLQSSYSKYAKVENRTGSVLVDRGQRDWSYDYKITLRYEPSRIEKNGDVVVFTAHGQTVRMEIKELQFKDEGKTRFVVLRGSTMQNA